MNLKMMKRLGTGAVKDVFKTLPLLAAMPVNFLKKPGEDMPVRTESAWDEERDDILERANWLCEKIIVSPKQLIKNMPATLGEEFGGQWAIYCCSMLAHALANIAVIYPDKAAQCPELIARLIDIVNTRELRNYDTIKFHEDAIDSLHGNKSHMTYLSILAWMISNYKLTGGDARFDSLFDGCCEALNRRMLNSRYDLNLLSFPNTPIFLPDMLVAIIALRNYARLNNGKYQDTVDKWLYNAQTKWLDKRTGLLESMLPGASRYRNKRSLRGSYVALNCSYLSMVDEGFAQHQHERMKAVMCKETSVFGNKVFGIKEYMHKSPKFSFDIDAGLVVNGLSASGSAFALGSCTFFGDWEMRSRLLQTAEVAGGTVKKNGKRHYRLGDVFITGEATALAMRTNIKR
ncbi:MAG: hypothetical protein MJZ69_10785 [Bacteroidaceae bacterium]|nr:hypothetical protein [Bacteroidaceae bacterium]